MRLKNRLFWGLAIAGLIFDQLTKIWVVKTFELYDTIPLWSEVFHFTYVTNKGAAFSLFSQNGEWLKWLSLLVSIALMGVGAFAKLSNRWEQAGYGFILAGAVGNGIDRFFAGEVVDFLDFRLIQFPVFNVADVCINIGIVCLLWAAFQTPQNAKENANKKIQS